MANADVEEKLRKLASVSRREAEIASRMYLASEGEERQRTDELLDVLLFQRIQKDYRERIVLEPPAPESCFGEYVLGSVMYPPEKPYCQFGLRENEWIKHVLICGMTGTGKTNLAFQILRELKRRHKPFIVFDWKRNYRDLLQLHEFTHVRVFTVGRNVSPFRFNPLLPPPGVEPGQWLMKLVDVIKHAYFVGEGVEFLLRDPLRTGKQLSLLFAQNPLPMWLFGGESLMFLEVNNAAIEQSEGAIAHHGVLDSGVAFLHRPFTPDSLARKAREVLDSDERAGSQGRQSR